ncbi:MAG TPA: GntR family transcriptional regulator [Candidatus Limnocylindrales bacterium]
MLLLQRPDTLTEAIRKYIRDAITRGVYAPGARLPEVALATELQTSRGTIREALRALADVGLVEVIPHRGVFVSRLSVSATWEITSLRALLEPYAARLALEVNADDGVMVEEVRAAFEALRRATTTDDPLAVADADVAFHRAVFARCGHRMLLDELAKLQVLSRRLVITNQLYAADAPALVGQHAPILGAVERRDPAAVEEAVRFHVIEAGELLLGRMAAVEARRDGVADDAPQLVAETYGTWPNGLIPNWRPIPGPVRPE